MENEQLYVISEETRSALLAYLYTQPFIKVEGGVVALRNLTPFKKLKSQTENHKQSSDKLLSILGDKI